MLKNVALLLSKDDVVRVKQHIMSQQQAQGQSVWANLPKEIVETLGLHLDAAGWASARSTCVHWSKCITHGINLLEIDLERDAHR